MRNLTARPDCVSADTVDSWPINSKAAHSLISGGKRRNAHMCQVQLPTSYSPLCLGSRPKLHLTIVIELNIVIDQAGAVLPA